MKIFLKRFLIVVGSLLGLMLGFIAVTQGPTIYRVAVGFHSHETVAPVLPADMKASAILVFSKTNGFRHEDAIPAANKLLGEIAARRGWSAYFTENGAVFNPEQLRRFKAVVWNNVSGDVLNPAQRAAFQAYLEGGGSFVGIHGAGGDGHYDWSWYRDSVLGAHFIGHPMGPQFQEAVLHVEDADHPATRGFDSRWSRSDEWYSFAASPRSSGTRVLVTLDENSYRPVMTLPFPVSLFQSAKDLRMGKDHPVVWTRCVGNGRIFYSALGHQASAYAEPLYQRMLDGALAWAVGVDGGRCVDGREDERGHPSSTEPSLPSP